MTTITRAAALLALLSLCGAVPPAHALTALSGAVAVSAGDVHSCALTAGGSVWCWGGNAWGQLGDGTTTPRLAAVPVPNLAARAIAAGASFTCALTTSGGVQCWGWNGSGQLGNGTTTRRASPTAVTGLASGVSAIAAALYHACALTSAGGVKCWGGNSLGQLGDGTTGARLTPVDVAGLGSGVAAITAGDKYTCALTNAGGVKCWGANQHGQLGDGTTSARLTPVDVVGLTSGVRAIAAGSFHTCALTTTGGVKCWGYNRESELGDGTNADRPTAADVAGIGAGAATLAGGASHTCAVITGGTQKCWGYNGWGQLGGGNTNARTTAVDVIGVSGSAIAIASGNQHSCVVTASGGVQCWGQNYYGQLGDNTTTQRLVPAEVMAASGSAPGAVPVIEFYNAGLDHYFITWMPDEIAKLDAGTEIKGWTRTGKSFPTYTGAQGGTSPVCRYYIPPGLGDSHFFGRGVIECNATGQKNPSFVLEDVAFMQMYLPAAGVCPAATGEIYRVFSNRSDANHRYMTDKTLRDQMVAQGWLAEGDGPNLVVMCAPQ